ncbi:MAG: diaminopimelate epimerase, partial [Clostridia bacterium]|nr:diaminopimelate epimerase [Clostridia bacterium]
YISKVTGVPMVDLASGVMIGEKLKNMGYGTGLYRTPPYFAVKVPVFSFEKLTGVNAYLGPEMKSTGEVLGIGKTVEEALFKGLTAASFSIKQPFTEDIGFFISVDSHDLLEVVGIAKKISDLGFVLYATPETADSIESLGIEVNRVKSISREDGFYSLLESGNISYILYTGALLDSTVEQYIAMHRRALQLSIPCFTSLDTANALADSIASRFNQQNTELVDINNLRNKREELHFAKMHATGDDYIFIENFDGRISCPESLCMLLCDRHTGIGGYGIVLIEDSHVADAKMRVFNRDGSPGTMSGNGIRSMAKYLYDNCLVHSEEMTVETAVGIKNVRVYTRNGKVSSAEVDMGMPLMEAEQIPCTLEGGKIINRPTVIGGKEYNITCVNMGNPHCVVFCDRVDPLDLERLGPVFENAPIFPQRTNTEFVRVVNPTTLKMRVYERGNRETYACGTGACAAVVAAVENGFCKSDTDITVKVKGGDLIVRYSDKGVTLTGDTVLVYEGKTSF